MPARYGFIAAWVLAAWSAGAFAAEEPAPAAARSGARKITFPGLRNVKRAAETLHGKKTKILGWMVPTDAATDVKYFLLVSNDQYCVHVPPPPLNQIVFVEAKQSARLVQGAPVYVTGDLTVKPRNHPVFGSVIYVLSADEVAKAY